ncbi:MAG: NAD+ synthase [Candidatus Omnitrophota bacterium]
MKNKIRFAIGQINSAVGDFRGNAIKIAEYIEKAKAADAEVIAFPELAITGYPPEDLLFRAQFIDENLASLDTISKATKGIAAIVGFVDRQKKDIYNAAAVLCNGKVAGVYHKISLPNYGVFDEKRYFKPGSGPFIFGIGKTVLGVSICEDLWQREGPDKREAAPGAHLIISINASPYHAGKTKERESVIRARAREERASLAYVNLVGGQDELVFDGQSMIIDDSGTITHRADPFREDLLIADIEVSARPLAKPAKRPVTLECRAEKKTAPVTRRKTGPLEPSAEIYEALKLGLKDYIVKNGFRKVVLGMSGGIDSSLVAALAADALGPENVTGVFMPSRYSSPASAADSKEVAGRLGIKFFNVPIDQLFKIYLLALEPHFVGSERGIAEENLQARIRGTILMALSNKFGWLVLITGNKSEMSTGYATLYGDMAGGFAPLKDVPKTLVYKLSKYRNSLGEVIPETVIRKEPTAELRPDQKDRDTLPPYGELDPILKLYVEEDRDIGEMVKEGFDKDTARKVMAMVDKSEYKRRQSPPGIKITPKAFGRDRRMPISNRYRG